MHRHRDVVAESEVIQHVDGEEHDNIWKPSSQRDGAVFEEEGRSGD